NDHFSLTMHLQRAKQPNMQVRHDFCRPSLSSLKGKGVGHQLGLVQLTVHVNQSPFAVVRFTDFRTRVFVLVRMGAFLLGAMSRLRTHCLLLGNNGAVQCGDFIITVSVKRIL
ncbi:MAG: hypothetical protein CUN57_03445, partial [Phototrophicales bacterium]